MVPAAKARRLQASWAEAFRSRALPLIDEEVFGVLLLKEMFDLTDVEALEQLEFNLQWHHALQLTPEEAHLPQKTLHNFRARVVAQDGGRVAFEAMTDRILQALDTKVSRQRLDSTHVISNIAVLTRLGLFCERPPAGVSVRPQGRAPAACMAGCRSACCGAAVDSRNRFRREGEPVVSLWHRIRGRQIASWRPLRSGPLGIEGKS